MHFWVEIDDQGDGFRMARAHRTWYGRPTKGLEKVEVPDYASDDPTVFLLELEADEQPEGKSVRMTGGAVVTAEPERYGDPDARLASGKKAPVRLTLGEWVHLP